ncbi:ABC transporter permease [Halotalea alkalilenta]|uniref:ABC transporter permease n=1 Tax=Halotalea alkalilenta TaxID=376489 RepID=UPI0004811233|nr:ABC transporter permease subunit [Halotalea alkalilenta]
MLGDYALTILGAARVTLTLAGASLLLSVVLGMVGAACKLSRRRWLRLLAGGYTGLMRGVPDLVLLLLVFYSLPALVNQGLEAFGSDAYFELDPWVAGILTLGAIFGGYMTETFRAALQNVPRGQIEAGLACGFGPIALLRLIIAPQMIRLALPGFANNWLVLAKATALVSLIGLHDVMFRARGAAEATGQPFLFYLVAAGFYLAVTLVSVGVLRLVADRYAFERRE